MAGGRSQLRTRTQSAAPRSQDSKRVLDEGWHAEAGRLWHL